jgi:pilus assembly protein CpaE
MTNMTGQRILVVDDDQALRRLVELFLRRAGYQVLTASTGEMGIEQVRTGKPDLVLMDVMLPGITGVQATKLIRRLPEGRHIPIIFLSAQADMETKVKGLRGGGNDYVTKPVKTGELLARIEAHLRPEVSIWGQLITVFGSKAGVGTTTLAINLALALRKASQENILLMDWQRPLGDVAFLLGMPETPGLELVLAHVNELDEEKVAHVTREYSPGVQVILGATNPNTAGQMNRKALSKLLGIALTRADYVVVDAGSFFSWEDPPMIAQGEGLNLCVLTPEPMSIKRAVQAMQTVNIADYEFWPILNQRNSPGDISQEQIESRLGTSLKGCIPESDQMVRATSEGHPFYMAGSSSDFSRAMDAIANCVIGVL